MKYSTVSLFEVGTFYCILESPIFILLKFVLGTDNEFYKCFSVTYQDNDMFSSRIFQCYELSYY